MTRAKDISKIITDADFSGTLDVTGAITVGDGHTIGNDGADNLHLESSTGEGIVLRSPEYVSLISGGTPSALVANNGDISFYEDTGTTPKLFWDASAERLGLGTSSPDEALHIHSDAVTTKLKITGTSGQGEDNGIKIWQNGVNTTIANADNGYMRFYTNNTERMRITSGGDFQLYEDTGTTPKLFWDASQQSLGVNTSSPASGYMLHVGGSSGVHTKVKIEATTATGQAELDLSADPAGVSYLNLGDENSYNIGYLGYFHSDNSMRFQTNSAERFHINSNGNAGLGVVPETTWHSNAHALQLGLGASIYGDNTATGCQISANTVATLGSSLNGYKYISSDKASTYQQYDGQHNFRVASSGSADGAITWNTVMIIENSGATSIFDHTASSFNQALGVSSKCTSRAGLQVTANNASFGNTSYGLVRLETVRANSNAFNYAIYRAGDGADTGFSFRGDGNAFADNNWNAGGADYAEYFEWKDGNTDDEDRRGFTVVLDGNKIRKSTSDDDASSIIGVVSAIPAVVGDSGQLGWQGKHERDKWGSYILEEYTQTEWTDADGELKSYQTDKIPSNVTVPDDALVTSTGADGKTKLMRRKESSSYDASLTYTPREDRKEWDTIGLMGKLRVRVGQTVGDRWIKMREISDTVHEYLVR
jgi:hypothetical protein